MKFATALLDRLVPGRGEEESTEAPAEESEATERPDGDPTAADIGRPEPSRVPDEDVSEEDLVLRQLIAHGGRVSRSTLAAETGWDEADLDDVLQGMEVDGQISTIRRRDPLVCRRGFEPAGAPLRFNDD
jgi:hypothetical protein